jgi:hypothetical protein
MESKEPMPYWQQQVSYNFQTREPFEQFFGPAIEDATYQLLIGQSRAHEQALYEENLFNTFGAFEASAFQKLNSPRSFYLVCPDGDTKLRDFPSFFKKAVFRPMNGKWENIKPDKDRQVTENVYNMLILHVKSLQAQAAARIAAESSRKEMLREQEKTNIYKEFILARKAIQALLVESPNLFDVETWGHSMSTVFFPALITVADNIETYSADVKNYFLEHKVPALIKASQWYNQDAQVVVTFPKFEAADRNYWHTAFGIAHRITTYCAKVIRVLESNYNKKDLPEFAEFMAACYPGNDADFLHGEIKRLAMRWQQCHEVCETLKAVRVVQLSLYPGEKQLDTSTTIDETVSLDEALLLLHERNRSQKSVCPGTRGVKGDAADTAALVGMVQLLQQQVTNLLDVVDV